MTEEIQFVGVGVPGDADGHVILYHLYWADYFDKLRYKAYNLAYNLAKHNVPPKRLYSVKEGNK